MTEFDGHIGIAAEGDMLNFICITKRAKHKIQAVNEKGREMKLEEKKILWQHPHTLNQLEQWPSVLATLQATVETLKNHIDVSLLWESALELQVSEMDDLADLYFGVEITVEHLVATWQALAENRLYFKRRGKAWEARSAEEVARLKQERKQEQTRAQEQARASDWLQKITKKPLPSFREGIEEEAVSIVDIPSDLMPFVARLEAWLRGDTDRLVEDLVTRLGVVAKLTPRELVFEVLLKTGRLPVDAERDIIVAGLKPEFPPAVYEAAQAVQPWVPDETQTVTALSFSIDDEETQEVDDALAIEREDDLWKITIAIADPAMVVHRGDSLDREAMRRGTTVYLPTQTVLMLPEPISCQAASLIVDEVRSALVIQAWLDEDGQLMRSNISRAPIQVQQRLHYSDVDNLLKQAQTTATAPLHTLLSLAKRLQAHRLAEGAFALQRPEYKVRIQAGVVKVTLIDRDSPSRLLVAEMMILANHIAAKYAYQHQIPFIYRTQEAPIEPITEELIADPLSFYKIRKLLRASSLSLQPGGHSSLGLSMYTQLTSPLRRFADLVMQRQLMAHWIGDALPYDQEELFKVLETAERTAREARMIEGDAKKRWFAQYLKQSLSEHPLETLVIETVKGGYRAEILPWGVEAFLTSTKKLTLGETVTTLVDKIRAKATSIRLKLT